MIVYKAREHSDKTKSSLLKLLSDRIVKPNSFPTYIFPICLFSNSFYKDLRISMKGLFIGNIIDNKFKLSLTSKVFSTRTRLPFNITGVVTDNLIEVKYQIPYFILLITFAFPIIDFILINGTSNFNGVLYLIAGLIIISYGIKIIRTRQIFKRICKKA